MTLSSDGVDSDSAQCAEYLQPHFAPCALRYKHIDSIIGPMKIGQLIRKARKGKGWTLQRMSDELSRAGIELDTGNLSRVETGKQGSSVETFTAILKLFDINVNEQLASVAEPGAAYNVDRQPSTVVVRVKRQIDSEGNVSVIPNSSESIALPTSDATAYVLKFKGDNYMPVIRNDWIVWVEPGTELVPFEYVIIETLDGKHVVKELLRFSEEEVSVQSITDNQRTTIKRSDIKSIQHVGGIMPPSKVQR